MRGIIGPSSINTPFQDGYFREIMTDAPLAFWADAPAGASTWEDQIGSLDLTFSGGATPGEPSLWLNGKSAAFDGVNGKASAAAVPAGLGATFTVEMLIRIGDQATFDAMGGILQVGDENVGNGFGLYFLPPGNYGPSTAGNLITFNDGMNGDAAYWQNVAVNTVCHLAATHDDATHVLKLYLNGTEVFSDDISIYLGGNLAAPTAKILLGRNEFAGAHGKFHAQHLALYNTVLSSTRILAHSRAALKTYDQCARSIDERIAGLTANDSTKKIFSSMTHTGTPAYTRNASCWAADLPIQCMSVWNSRGGVNGGGIAIAKDIVWMAYHYALGQVGDTLRFVTAGNVIVNRTIAATARVGTTDIQLCRLDSDLPDTIPPARVLPDGWEDHFLRVTGDGNNNIGERLPVLMTDQEKKALVADIETMQNSTGSMIIHTSSPDAQRQAFYEEIITGDSGCPVCLIVAGQVVPLTLFHSGIRGTAISAYRDEVETANAALGSVNTLTDVSITGLSK